MTSKAASLLTISKYLSSTTRVGTPSIYKYSFIFAILSLLNGIAQPNVPNKLQVITLKSYSFSSLDK